MKRKEVLPHQQQQQQQLSACSCRMRTMVDDVEKADVDTGIVELFDYGLLGSRCLWRSWGAR